MNVDVKICPLQYKVFEAVAKKVKGEIFFQNVLWETLSLWITLSSLLPDQLTLSCRKKQCSVLLQVCSIGLPSAFPQYLPLWCICGLLQKLVIPLQILEWYSRLQGRNTNCKRQKVRDEDKKFNFINLKSLLCINSFGFSFYFFHFLFADGSTSYISLIKFRRWTSWRET